LLPSWDLRKKLKFIPKQDKADDEEQVLTLNHEKKEKD
jgi:hypothetical protein